MIMTIRGMVTLTIVITDESMSVLAVAKILLSNNHIQYCKMTYVNIGVAPVA